MCEKGNYFRGIQNTLHKRTERNYYTRTFGMESNWTKYRKPFAFTDQVIGSATSFMPWSLKIPIILDLFNQVFIVYKVLLDSTEI